VSLDGARPAEGEGVDGGLRLRERARLRQPWVLRRAQRRAVERLELDRAGIACAERRGISALVLWLKGETLWMLFDLGQWDEVLRLAGGLIEWDRSHGGSYFGVWALTYKASVLLHRGRVDEATELSDEFTTRARKIGDPQILAPASVARGVARSLAGDGTQSGKRLSLAVTPRTARQATTNAASSIDVPARCAR
jgi:ATP/maltotriose-dependent transcriptional regulator MalT